MLRCAEFLSALHAQQYHRLCRPPLFVCTLTLKHGRTNRRYLEGVALPSGRRLEVPPMTNVADWILDLMSDSEVATDIQCAWARDMETVRGEVVCLHLFCVVLVHALICLPCLCLDRGYPLRGGGVAVPFSTMRIADGQKHVRVHVCAWIFR